MGLAQNGVAVPSGNPLAIQGVLPTGIAIRGETVWLASEEPAVLPWQLLNIINSRLTNTMDTSSANLLVAFLASSTSAVLSMADSLLNTWTPATGNGAGCAYSSLHYCISPTTGTAHVFTGIGGSYGGFIVAAFKCVGTPTFSNQTNAVNQGGQTSIQLPPITVNKGDLIVTGASNCGGNILSIDSSFNIDMNSPRITGGNIAYASGSLISNSSQSVSPTWNADFSVYPTNPSLAATMVSFTSAP